MSPRTRPASLSTFRCWETVDWARGSSSTMSPQMQASRRTSSRRIWTRAGWPTALARSASSSSASAPSTGRRSGASFDSGAGPQVGTFLSRGAMANRPSTMNVRAAQVRARVSADRAGKRVLPAIRAERADSSSTRARAGRTGPTSSEFRGPSALPSRGTRRALTVRAAWRCTQAWGPSAAGAPGALPPDGRTMADPTIAEVAKSLTETQNALNIVWTMVAAFLVMFMQAGFALVETGLTRAKNVAHTMGMNFFVYAIGIIGFYFVGFGLQMGGMGPMATFGNEELLKASSEFTITLFGKSFGLFGTSGFMLPLTMFTPAVAATFLFQMVFMDTTATIPTGAAAERWKFMSFVIFSFLISTLIYPIYANWVWGGGWLSQLGANFGLGHGHVDFAGSSVVHMTGGVAAIVLAKMIGPRLGKYGKDGRINPIPAHNIPQVMIGTFILAFGWFGFNAGSTLSGMDTRLANIAVNTMIASATGAFGAYLYCKARWGKADPSWMANGMLAGLVAITAPCAFVSAWAAALIGAVAGVLVILAAVFIDAKLKIDDPVGASAVHGVNGAWGIVSLGLFANGAYGQGLNGVARGVTGLFYGDAGQLGAELVGLAANVLWVAPVAALAFWIIGKVVGNRISAEDEINGADLGEMGVLGYAPDAGPHLGTTPR